MKKRYVILGVSALLVCGLAIKSCMEPGPERLGIVKASEMCDVYDEQHGGNTVTGDLKYKGKQADIVGSISKAPYYSGFSNTVMIDIDGGHDCSIQVRMQKEKIPQVEGLKVGEQITVGCLVEDNSTSITPSLFSFKKSTKVEVVDCIMVKRSNNW